MHVMPSTTSEKPRSSSIHAGFRLLVAIIAVSIAPTSFAAPFRPSDGTIVIYVVPHRVTAARTQEGPLATRLEADPTDLDAAVEVARLAIRAGRASADPRLYGRAQAALSPWWREAAPPPEVRLLRAVIRQASHDFDGALADLDAVLATRPDDGQARLSRAFVLQAIGALDRAQADCRALPHSVGFSARAACGARVAAATGGGAPAFDRLRQVLVRDLHADPATRRFAIAIAAEIASALGCADEAERYFVAATQHGSDLPSLLAYADFLLDAGRPTEVLALLVQHSDIDAALLRLAIAGKATSDPRAAAWTGLLVERFAVARAGKGPLHLREEARFTLELGGDPHKALDLALANWAIEKEPGDARLVLAAAIAAARPAAATPVLEFVARSGLVDRHLEALRDRLARLPVEASAPLLAPLPATR